MFRALFSGQPLHVCFRVGIQPHYGRARATLNGLTRRQQVGRKTARQPFSLKVTLVDVLIAEAGTTVVVVVLALVV